MIISDSANIKVMEHLQSIILAVRNDTLYDVGKEIERVMDKYGETEELLYLLVWIKKGGNIDGFSRKDTTD